MTVNRLSLPAALTIACLSFTSLVVPAYADTLQDASRLLKQGQQSQALEQVDKYLAGKPKDAQGRFLKGIILTEMNRNAEALTVFNKLTEDYPELPEPYNNMAVIYAQQKQYDKAKQALEMAIRTHPSYATAHENLGDLYARLASQAYDKALQLDSSNSSAQNKLALIRDLMSPGTKIAATKPTPVEPSKPTTPPTTVAPPTPTVIATAPTKPAEPPKVETKPEPKVELKPEPKVETKPEPKTEPKNNGSDPSAEVGKALDAWANAWSKKDIKAYLARYAKDFKVPGGESRSSWEAERTARVTKPGKISVVIENLKVTVDAADQVTAKFRQHYKSASLSSSSNKMVTLVKRDGKWLIQQERIGS
ncbi:MAG TPA: tetratricopeptide repeat protein [Rhodocyclaceae bacterium]|nr:tetratricopeptide repeat protein [Rhodocyclaceae bacterium]